MKVNRRAFLQVLAASAAAGVLKPLDLSGSVQFDPLSKLWVPTPENRVQAFLESVRQVESAAAKMGTNVAERVYTERIGALDDLATEYAKLLAEKHYKDNIVVVSEVQYRAALADAQRAEEWFDLPTVTKHSIEDRRGTQIKRRKSSKTGLVSTLNVEEEGTGEFAGHRCVDGLDHWHGGKASKIMDCRVDPFYATSTSRTWHRPQSINMVAPITHELRPGVPFTEDTLVGVGINRETGLMVRLVQSENVMNRSTVLHAEIAGGHWSPIEEA